MGLSRRVPVSNVASTHRIPERFTRPACGYTAQVGSAKAATAAPLVPSRPTLKRLRQAAAVCRACELWRKGTQTVFGEGSPSAAVMLVGEQPGDREDLQGRPFVGPAGPLLDASLADAGIGREDAYLTNLVKHFNWEERGNRRIHRKPNLTHITARRPWLEAEIQVVRPEILVLLGATATQALLGRTFRVTQHRGEFPESSLGPLVTATVHPSSILRAPDSRTRHAEREAFVRDLRAVARAIRH
jgi:uracil-DNA glycosylase family protein